MTSRCCILVVIASVSACRTREATATDAGGPSDAKTEEVTADATTLKLPPWHLADIWWTLPADVPFESYAIDFEIDRDVDPATHLYVAAVGLGTFVGAFGKVSFYGGLQTQSGGFVSATNHHLQSIGRGAIFSRWGERSADALRIGPGGVFESADYEGDFISVRNRFAWTRGHYTATLAKRAPPADADAGNFTWVEMTVTRTDDGARVDVGALRFPSPLALLHELASFLEIYGSPIRPDEIPPVTVTFGPVRVNGEEAHTRARVSYPADVPSYALATAAGSKVVVQIGHPFTRASGTHRLF